MMINLLKGQPYSHLHYSGFRLLMEICYSTIKERKHKTLTLNWELILTKTTIKETLKCKN